MEHFVDDFGTVLRIHDRTKCAGRHCVVHTPSIHHMQNFKLLWRADESMFERICPHGVGHPDPDALAFQIAQRELAGGDTDFLGTHGCDGCCNPERYVPLAIGDVSQPLPVRKCNAPGVLGIACTADATHVCTDGTELQWFACSDPAHHAKAVLVRRLDDDSFPNWWPWKRAKLLAD